jgi:hypothetical protein
MNDEPTPLDAFRELRPTLERVGEVINAAPLSLESRAGLAILVASFFVGFAVKAMRRAWPEEPNDAILHGILQNGLDEADPASRLSRTSH